MIFKKTKTGQLGENAAVIAGLGGGIITILIYCGVSMSGPLGLFTQVMGALGVIAAALWVWSNVAK